MQTKTQGSMHTGTAKFRAVGRGQATGGEPHMIARNLLYPGLGHVLEGGEPESKHPEANLLTSTAELPIVGS